MSPEAKLAVTVCVIVASMAAGYVARRMRLASERVAEVLMTLVVVCGYTPVAFLSIWGLGRVDISDVWLPVLAAVHWLLMAMAGLAVGRLMTADRARVGTLGLAAGAGNTGFTMGGFVIFLLYGQRGLGLASIYCLMWTPMMVLMLYPIARRFAPGAAPAPLGWLLLRSLFDWRSIGLPAAGVALFLLLCGVERPAAVSDWRVVDVLMYAVTAAAYFSIGLRLHAAHFLSAWRLIAALGALRFGLGAAVGLVLAGLAGLTPWPMSGLARKVFVIESFVPTAVTMVAVCNMFHLRPREASVLFIANTGMYLAGVLPVVVWLLG